jgi:putative flippase GtrA
MKVSPKPAGGPVPKSARKQTVEWSVAFLKECCELKPSRKSSVQLVRSLAVSVIALIVDFSTLVFLKEAGNMHYLLAAALGFSLGVVVNYILSVKWVFANRKFASKHAEFTIFVVICAIGLALNLLIIWGLVQLTLDYRVAKAISTVIVFFWNFVARKKILY